MRHAAGAALMLMVALFPGCSDCIERRDAGGTDRLGRVKAPGPGPADLVALTDGRVADVAKG